MALEDLLKVNIVSAPKFAENPDQIPSVVSILTAEDIRLYGWQTLGAALRSLQGFNVTDNHTHAYGGVRGISQPGDYRPRLQILIDGQSINENIYASAPVTSAFHRKDAEAQRKSQGATEKVQKLGITCQVKAFLCAPPHPLRLCVEKWPFNCLIHAHSGVSGSPLVGGDGLRVIGTISMATSGPPSGGRPQPMQTPVSGSDMQTPMHW